MFTEIHGSLSRHVFNYDCLCMFDPSDVFRQNFHTQAEALKYLNALDPRLDNNVVITVWHHIHCTMLKYVDTLPAEVWLLVWKMLAKMSFPTLDRLGYPLILGKDAKSKLDLLEYSMEAHPLYSHAVEYPVEAVDEDMGAI